MPLLGSIIKGAIEFPSKIPFEKVRNLSPIRKQQITLRKLISRAQYTSLGEEYEFGDLLKKKDLISNFKQAVPVNDYNSIHQKWWYRTLHGETFVAWPGKIKYFALSSGTSEASSKYIPVTGDMIKAIKRTSIRQIFSYIFLSKV